jgi:capsular exopolysaccharide synthesis family protein
VTAAVLAKTTILETPVYQGGFQLLIDDAGTQFKAETPGKNDEKSDAAVNEQDFETLITLMRSPIVLGKVASRLQEQGQSVSLNELQGAIGSSKLTINRLNESGTVSFAYEDSSPAKIEAVLDTFAGVLKDYGLERNRDRVRTSIEFLNSQFPGLQASVQRQERRLQEFRETNNFIDPENLVAAVTADVNANRQQLKDVQFQLNQAQANKRILEDQLAVKADNAISVAALSESSRYQALLNDLLEIDKKIAVESARLQPDSPIFTALKSRRQELQRLLKAESSKLLGVSRMTRQRSQLTSTGLALNQRLIENANQVRVLSNQRQYLERQARVLSQRERQVPLLTRQYQALKRELDVAESNLTNFLEAREKYRLQLAQSAVPWEVISPPQVGLLPIFPKVPQSFALSISLGILAGMGAAIYRDRSDNVFRSIQQVQVELPGVPVIAAVPHLAQLAPSAEEETDALTSITDDAPDVEESEAEREPPEPALTYYWQDPTLEYFRGLATRLDFFSPDRPLQAIAVASSVPNEGKSTVSLQLAQAAATLGKRVLLIDADLRRPKLHERVGLENTVGLSNLLTSQATIHEVLQVISSDLSILTAGTVQADPARLLGSNRMQELVTSLRNSGLFDLIIFDTPPLLGITDTSILSKHNLDGLLLVLGLGYTDRDAVRSVVEQLQIGTTPLLGVVANVPRGDVRVDTAGPGSGRYRYYAYTEQESENRLQQMKKRLQQMWSQL